MPPEASICYTDTPGLAAGRREALWHRYQGANDAGFAELLRIRADVKFLSNGARVVAMVNLLLQAGLLAISLVNIAHQENLVPLWLAVVAAVGGLLLLPLHSVLAPTTSQMTHALVPPKRP